MPHKLTVASFASLAAIIILDYATGYEVALQVLYLVPVSLAAWQGARSLALGLAVLGAGAWCLVDWLAGHLYSREILRFGNGLVVLAGAIAAALLVDRLHRSRTELRQMTDTIFARRAPERTSPLDEAASGARAKMRRMQADRE